MLNNLLACAGEDIKKDVDKWVPILEKVIDKSSEKRYDEVYRKIIEKVRKYDNVPNMKALLIEYLNENIRENEGNDDFSSTIQAEYDQYYAKIEEFYEKKGDIPNSKIFIKAWNKPVEELNVLEFNNLKEMSKFNISSNYREDMGDVFLFNMVQTIGMENAKEMTSIPDIPQRNIEMYALESSKEFNRLFEQRYTLQGDIPLISDMFKDIRNEFSERDSIKIFKKVNEHIQDYDKNKSLNFNGFIQMCVNEAGVRISDKSEKRVKQLEKNISIKLTNNKIEEMKKELSLKVDNFISSGNSLDSQEEVIKRIISKSVKNSLNSKDGRFEAEDVYVKLKEELFRRKESGEAFYSGHVTGQIDKIELITKQLLEDSSVIKILSGNIVDRALDAQKAIGKRWIMKLAEIPDELSREEYEKLNERLGFKVKETHVGVLRDDKLKEIKDPVKKELKRKELEKEAYQYLSDLGFDKILTYEKAELMFSGIVPPYSKEFASFFDKNKEEIMSNPEFYSEISKIHNRFDEVIQSSIIKNRYKSGKITVAEILTAVKEVNYDSIGSGEHSLARFSKDAGESQNEFYKAKSLFEKSRARETRTIPPMRAASKRGEFRGRLLGVDDALQIFAGNATTCCQKIGDVGEGAMIHGVTEKNGGIFVVEMLNKETNSFDIVAQSWVWRSRDRMCFDNIEVARDGKAISYEDKIKVLEIYKDAATQAIQRDQKILEKMLKTGEITQEIYDTLVLKQVTVGSGYNDIEPLIEQLKSGELKTASIVLPNLKGDVWLDSNETQITLAEINEKAQVEIEGRKIKGEHNLEEISNWYKDRRQVSVLRNEEIDPDIVKAISNIESAAYEKKEQQLLGGCYDKEELLRCYGFKEDEDIQVDISSGRDWYCITSESENELYIADLAMIGGLNSKQHEEEGNQIKEEVNIESDVRAATFEIAERLYSMMQSMAEKGGNVRFEATRDTSYINVTKLIKQGLVEVIEDEKSTFCGTDIPMNNMLVKPNKEALEKALVKIRAMLEKVYENRMLEENRKLVSNDASTKIENNKDNKDNKDNIDEVEVEI